MTATGFADPLEDTVRAYAECALWSSTGDDGQPLDTNYCLTDISDETWEVFRRDCNTFLSLAGGEILSQSGLTLQEVGHDLWLTRNGHGSGFWDRGLGQTGEHLTVLTKAAFGEQTLYIGVFGNVEVL